jgi:hypothetical protein
MVYRTSIEAQGTFDQTGARQTIVAIRVAVTPGAGRRAATARAGHWFGAGGSAENGYSRFEPIQRQFREEAKIQRFTRA